MPNTNQQRHISRLASLVNHLLRQDYNTRDVFTFKQMWPEQPWWTMDFVTSHPDACRHVNDPAAASRGCTCHHTPRCRSDQLRCFACNSHDHFAFYGCPVIGAILESMRVAQCTDEQLLLTFAKHSFNDAFRAQPPGRSLAGTPERQIRNALVFIRAARERSYARRCVRHKFGL